VNNRLIVYFASNPAVSSNPQSEVWVLDHANGLGGTPTWMQLVPTGTPPVANALPSALYHASSNRLVVYGGCFSNCGLALSDVFVLSNANGLGGTPVWSQSTVSNPQPRDAQTAVYDEANNLKISFGGGLAFFGTDQNDTRVLSNANGVASPSTWRTLAPAGALPAAREEASAAYDAANNRMILYGGNQLITTCCPYNIADYNDSWVLSGANGLAGPPAWTQLSPTGTLPPRTIRHSMIYDAQGNRVIVMGGLTWSNPTQSYTIQGDLWELSYANGLGGSPAWRQMAPSGTPPGLNYGHVAVYDAASRRMIVFGGSNYQFQAHRRVWVLVLLQTVALDIKPGSDSNSINTKSKGKIPVAILSSADFDSPATVDQSSLTFGRSGDELSLAFCNTGGEDVNGDARLDLICQFFTQKTGFQAGDTEGILRGQTTGGQPIEGRDAVIIVS
jgi:hypothetical protein